MTASPTSVPRRVVVTGAAGFIGCHLVEKLVGSQCADVVGIDSERSGDWSRLRVNCTRVHRDLTLLEDSELDAICDGADVLFHLAAEKHNSSKSTPQRVIDVNISATNRLFAAAARAGVTKVVFTSSLYAYGSMGPDSMREDQVLEPNTTYGLSKVAGEHLLRVAQRETGLRWSVARLFFVYGPRQYAAGGYKSVIMSNFERIRAGQAPTVYGDGRQALDYVYVDDVVHALLGLIAPEHDGRVYNIGTGTAVAVRELTQLMLDVAGSDLEAQSCPPDWTAGSVRVADTRLVRERLGWVPEVSLRDGLNRIWEWLAANHD